MASGGSPASRKSRIARGVKAVVRDPKAVSRLWRRGDVSLSAGELSGFRDADGQESRIFFVVGFPKSGTTWLMETLDAHPEVLCRGEGRFFDRGMRREHFKGMETSAETTKQKLQPASLYNALAEDEYLKMWVERSVWSRDDDAEEHLKNLTRLAAGYFLRAKLSASGKQMVGDKTPLSSDTVVAEIADLFPDAKVVHLVRDGRDAAVSLIHHNWKRASDRGGVRRFSAEETEKRDRYWKDPTSFGTSGESLFTEKRLRHVAEIWGSRVSAARRDGRSLLGGNYTELRYEDLLERPEKVFGGVFSFLGADANEKTVHRCAEATSFERRSGGRQRGQEDAKSGVRKGVAGDWKGVFTERDRTIFDEEAGPALAEVGYERSDG
ncbi:sulfotransferase [soil metagenome]